MGFIVKKPVEDIFGETYDSFYVRIESCVLMKVTSQLLVVVAHYKSPEHAYEVLGKYIEDDLNGVGPISTRLFVDGSDEPTDFSMNFMYNLTVPETLSEDLSSIVNKPFEVEYIDFDENGNEFTATRTEYREVAEINTINTTKHKRIIGDVKIDVYTLGYGFLKETYKNLFSGNTIIDKI